MQSNKCFSETETEFSISFLNLNSKSIRFSDKRRKVKFGADTRYYIRRGKVSVRQGNRHANSRQNGKIKSICNGSEGKCSVSKAISANSRCNGLMYRDNSKCKTPHEANTATSFTLLETNIQRFASADTKVAASVRSLELVVTGSQHSKRQVIVFKAI